MADELKRVDVFMGPYRGHFLDMPAAEADAAVNAHWARDPYSTEPYGTGHDALSDEERAAAWTAATDWAQAQWAPFVEAAPEPPPPEGTAQRRAMQPERPAGYVTRKA